MTLYKTDFSEYTTGNQPSDWTERWNINDGSASIAEIADSIGGKVLTLSKTNTSRYALSWNDVGTPADIEVLVRARRTTNDNQLVRIYIRGSGSVSSESGYGVFWDSAAGGWRVHKYVNGVYSGLYLIIKSVALEYWWIRIRMQGTALKVKTWKDADQEPSNWNYEAVESSLSSGWVGVGAVYNYQYYDWFAAETDSGSWPILAPYELKNASLDLSAYYQKLEDLGLKLLTCIITTTIYSGYGIYCGEGWWCGAPLFVMKDVNLDLSAYGREIEDFRAWLRAVSNSLHDFGAMLAAADGIILKDMAAFLAATDGIVLKDMGLFMQVISASPVFRTRISQRMTSIAREVT